MNEQSAEAFTPSELASPNPALFRAMSRRMEALLLKHEPDIFPKWKALIEQDVQAPVLSQYWGQMLFYIAAVLPLRKRGDWEWDINTPEQERRIGRNWNLITTLVFRGCKERGEFLTPAEREARLKAQEAEYREQYGEAAYHRLIENREPEQGQEQQEAA